MEILGTENWPRLGIDVRRKTWRYMEVGRYQEICRLVDI